MSFRSCVSPSGTFIYGLHQPCFEVDNFREGDFVTRLGKDDSGSAVDNRINFPVGPVWEKAADPIFEIPNAFSFRGTTYIARSWADAKARDPHSIRLPPPVAVSLSKAIEQWCDIPDATGNLRERVFDTLPDPLRLALATCSDDPADLIQLAELSCAFERDSADGTPAGLRYNCNADGRVRPLVYDHELFEAVANNPCLPEVYQRAMVLIPGAQGDSEIVGECGKCDDKAGNTHVWEYLRRNSYIPWGHYAANMAHDAVRYDIHDLGWEDMQGLRHLYYQRTYTRLARDLNIPLPAVGRSLTMGELEALRIALQQRLRQGENIPSLSYNATLWGWNYGFDFSPSRYRLNASHQQIHQQYALIPPTVPGCENGSIPDQGRPGFDTFACGDLITQFIIDYHQATGRPFFDAYIDAIDSNRRMDGNTKGPHSLIVYADRQVMLFVPKAQTSQWELQLMVRPPMGHILDTDEDTRQALDRGILVAMQILRGMGARLTTIMEYSKRFNHPNQDQRLLYVFLPKIPQSPGGFSENQLRWINGHYPEDFAAACRACLERLAQ